MRNEVNVERLSQVFDSLVSADRHHGMADVFTRLVDVEVEAVLDDLSIRFGEELAVGAMERSQWVCGTFIINANQPQICFVQRALELIRGEADRRAVTEPAAGGLEC